jgi:hypothetical protein
MKLRTKGRSFVFSSYSSIWMKLYSLKKLRAIFVNGSGDELFFVISVKLCNFPSLRDHSISSSVDKAVSSER